MNNPVRWFEIYVQDMPRAKAFYEKVLGLKLQRLGTPASVKASGLEMWSFPAEKEAPGCAGALAKMPGAPSGGMGTIVYFASDDCAVEEKCVKAAGGSVQRGKTPIGEYGFITLALDTEGNMFGIHSMK